MAKKKPFIKRVSVPKVRFKKIKPVSKVSVPRIKNTRVSIPKVSIPRVKTRKKNK